MKRLIAVLLGGAILFSSFSLTAPVVDAVGKNTPVIVGGPELAVIVNGKKVKFDSGDPVMENGRVQVPLRGVGEELGAKVGYKGKKVSYTKGNKTISLTLGSNKATVDGMRITMDTKAKAVKGRTYVPLRFVSENLGEKVSWDKAGQWVWIGEKNIPSTDDEQFKMKKLSDFSKYYNKTPFLLKNISDKPYEGIKIFNISQLPLQLADDFIIYDMYLVKKDGNDYLAVRSNENGNPIYFMEQNNYAHYRRDVHNGGTINGDGTITNYYPVQSRNDTLIDGKDTGIDWTKFKLKSADYIAFSAIFPENYIVAFTNPFK
ncbi:copper amine oxidase N-terminal domain-containing protein [Paenibacillus oralis]|uniref:Copper amine oxidase N-terminal domain-containing protein n=1 Tax=Paenibacillus oralis TaxID=2490856 RepID=A0A3P3T9Q3_9BACL|nr:copper amine oxidase N-terminal domain-containing protein [Paenibacillus oralis]RRJ54785.1 copper amine oxidase N-terminal domain-containing protein [Paenibacillus oralis]